MAIDTNEKKLSLIDWGEYGVPLPDGSLDQGDNQHLIGEYSGIAFNTLAASNGRSSIQYTWLLYD